jgi:hypothetical protein
MRTTMEYSIHLSVQFRTHKIIIVIVIIKNVIIQTKES